MSELGCANSLAALACAEGGWCYAPDQQPHLEPTCLALLALAGGKDGHSDILDRAVTWLGQCAVGDGTYRLARGRHEAAWSTALVLFTLAELSRRPSAGGGFLAPFLLWRTAPEARVPGTLVSRGHWAP